jgi:hypothetical protein
VLKQVESLSSFFAKNLSKPQACKAACVRGLHRAAKSSISCSHSFHSIMFSEDTYKAKIKNFIIPHIFVISDDFQKHFKTQNKVTMSSKRNQSSFLTTTPFNICQTMIKTC